MQKIINFFRGSVRLEVTGPFPERFLNLCAQNYLSFWDVQWLEDGGVRLTLSRRDSRRAAGALRSSRPFSARTGKETAPPA